MFDSRQGIRIYVSELECSETTLDSPNCSETDKKLLYGWAGATCDYGVCW